MTLALPAAGPVSPLLARPGLKQPAFASIPDYYDTLGDEAADFVASDCGLTPDPQQRLGLDIIFARDKRGRSAAFSLTAIAARQMLKSGLWKMAALSWLYLFEEPLVTWSAHRAETSFAAQEDLEKLIEASDVLRRATRRIVHGNGQEAIETTGRCKVNFRTRTKTGGKGLSANKVILDEAFALQLGHMGALLPTLTAMPDPQVMYGSSAAMTDSEILHDKIRQGRPGTERDWVTTEPLHQIVHGPMAAAYLEWCAPPPEIACQAGVRCTHARTAQGCGCDNEEWQLRANPAVGPVELIGTPGGPRSTIDYIRAERGELPPSEFARERMGWHDVATGGAGPWPMTMWYGCSDRESTPAAGSSLALAISVAHDRSATAIGLAGWREDGLPHGEIVEHRPGTGWALDALMGLVERNNPCCVALDPASRAGAFEKQLYLRGFVTVPKDKPGPPKLPPGKRLLMVCSAREVAQASGMLTDAVLDGTFRHPDQAPLNDAARDVRPRPVAQAYAWDSPDGKDISPIESVTLAQLGLATFGAKRVAKPFFLV